MHASNVIIGGGEGRWVLRVEDLKQSEFRGERGSS